MAGLENLWSHFSLDNEEEYGAEVPKPVEEVVHRLAGRFFTKRTLNVESVARTFKPLWNPTGRMLSPRSRSLSSPVGFHNGLKVRATTS